MESALGPSIKAQLSRSNIRTFTIQNGITSRLHTARCRTDPGQELLGTNGTVPYGCGFGWYWPRLLHAANGSGRLIWGGMVLRLICGRILASDRMCFFNILIDVTQRLWDCLIRLGFVLEALWWGRLGRARGGALRAGALGVVGWASPKGWKGGPKPFCVRSDTNIVWPKPEMDAGLSLWPTSLRATHSVRNRGLERLQRACHQLFQ